MESNNLLNIFCLIQCKFCIVSLKGLLLVASIFNLGLDFKITLNNNKHYFYPCPHFFSQKKSGAIGSTTFLSGGVFLCFFTKIRIFMNRVLVLSIKFSSSCITCSKLYQCTSVSHFMSTPLTIFNKCYSGVPMSCQSTDTGVLTWNGHTIIKKN